MLDAEGKVLYKTRRNTVAVWYASATNYKPSQSDLKQARK